MENDNKEENKKVNKKHIARDLVVCALIILPLALIVMVLVQSKTSSKLSKSDKEFFNEVTMLYNESVSDPYVFNTTQDEYVTFIADTKEHLRLLENRIVSKNFKYKKQKTVDETYSEHSMSLTYTGLKQTKSIYYLYYNKTNDGFIGTIEESGYAKATFVYKTDTDKNSLTLTGGDKGCSYSMTYYLDTKLYKIYETNDDLKQEYILDFENSQLKITNKIYNFALIGTQIQISLYGTDTISQIELISRKDTYVYQYNFLIVGEDNQSYEVER